MPLYEVAVQRIVTDYYEIDAKSESDARKLWPRGIEAGSIVDEENVIEVTEVIEDEGIEYDIDFENEEDYDG